MLVLSAWPVSIAPGGDGSAGDHARNLNGKGRSPVGGLNTDRPMMRLRNALADVKAKPQTGSTSGAVRPSRSRERVKQRWDGRRRYGIAFVGDHDRHLFLIGPRFDHDFANAVANGVGQKIDNQLSDSITVPYATELADKAKMNMGGAPPQSRRCITCPCPAE